LSSISSWSARKKKPNGKRRGSALFNGALSPEPRIRAHTSSDFLIYKSTQ
jgi:hypothetical protein